MVWLGIDDTDSLDGGCTTDLLDRLITNLVECESRTEVNDLRLVRCWPMAPHRTRGNGAVACQLQIPWTLDELMDWSIEWFENERPWSEECSPALIISEEQLTPTLYWSAVRKYVEPSTVYDELDSQEIRIWTPKSDNGIVGASAAIAWPGTSDWSWELIAYREEQNSNRDIELKVLQEFDPDPEWNGTHLSGRIPCVPHTSCPVLFGLRTRERFRLDKLDSALPEIWTRPGLRSWRIFRSNQGTDDHLEETISGQVIESRILKGGHVRMEVDVEGEHVVWIAFREGGDVTKIARNLVKGEEIEGAGMVVEDGGTRHMESLRVLKSPVIKIRCDCGGSLTSMGTGQGRRCRKCRQRFPIADESKIMRQWSKWARPPTDRRRHLSRKGNPPSLNLRL